jgi:DNA polymerase-3 subunit epsilon
VAGGSGWASGRLVGFDIETTGLDVERDEPVSYAFVEFVGGVRADVDEAFVLPARAISQGATAVHGLRRRRLRALGAVSLEVAARAIAARLVALSAEGTPVVGCNLAYDLTIVDRVLSRLSPATSLRDEGWCGPALDVLVLDRALDGDFEGRPARRLEALCDHYRLGLPGHTAATDAEAAVNVLLAQVTVYGSLAASSLIELQSRQAEWHTAWQLERAARRETLGQGALFELEEPWPYPERIGIR